MNDSPENEDDENEEDSAEELEGEALVQELVAMGFGREMVVEMLALADGDIEGAMMLLLS